MFFSLTFFTSSTNQFSVGFSHAEVVKRAKNLFGLMYDFKFSVNSVFEAIFGFSMFSFCAIFTCFLVFFFLVPLMLYICLLILASCHQREANAFYRSDAICGYKIIVSFLFLRSFYYLLYCYLVLLSTVSTICYCFHYFDTNFSQFFLCSSMGICCTFCCLMI